MLENSFPGWIKQLFCLIRVVVLTMGNSSYRLIYDLGKKNKIHHGN